MNKNASETSKTFEGIILWETTVQFNNSSIGTKYLAMKDKIMVTQYQLIAFLNYHAIMLAVVLWLTWFINTRKNYIVGIPNTCIDFKVEKVEVIPFFDVLTTLFSVFITRQKIWKFNKKIKSIVDIENVTQDMMSRARYQ